MMKYLGKLIPKKSWLDVNGDGSIDHHDLINAAQKVVDTITPSKNAFDINGDGVVDINDALDAARIESVMNSVYLAWPMRVSDTVTH